MKLLHNESFLSQTWWSSCAADLCCRVTWLICWENRIAAEKVSWWFLGIVCWWNKHFCGWVNNKSIKLLRWRHDGFILHIIHNLGPETAIGTYEFFRSNYIEEPNEVFLTLSFPQNRDSTETVRLDRATTRGQTCQAFEDTEVEVEGIVGTQWEERTLFVICDRVILPKIEEMKGWMRKVRYGLIFWAWVIRVFRRGLE